MDLSAEQPMPTRNDSVSVQAMVRADLLTREQVGISRYGTALQPNNGRDALRDAYEEAVDLACYLRQAIEERDLAAAGQQPPTPAAHVDPLRDGLAPVAVVDLGGERRTIEGRVVAPGLAVVPGPPRSTGGARYDLVHIATGRYIVLARCARHIADAVELATGIGVDWAVAGEALRTAATADLSRHVRRKIGLCDLYSCADPAGGADPGGAGGDR